MSAEDTNTSARAHDNMLPAARPSTEKSLHLLCGVSGAIAAALLIWKEGNVLLLIQLEQMSFMRKISHFGFIAVHRPRLLLSELI